MMSGRIRIGSKALNMEILPALRQFSRVLQVFGGKSGLHANAFAVAVPASHDISNDPMDLLKLVIASRTHAFQMASPPTAPIGPEIIFEDSSTMTRLYATGQGAFDATLELVIFRDARRPRIQWTGSRDIIVRDATLLGTDGLWVPTSATYEELPGTKTTALLAAQRAAAF